MILLNAHGLVLGRLASFAAKNLMNGEKIIIVNAEEAIVTGSRDSAMKKLRTRINLQAKGNPRKGPKYSRMPDRVMRMAVRGMLPWKSKRGRDAYRNIRVFISVPEKYEGKEFTEVPKASKKLELKHTELGEVCRLLGAKW